MTLSAFSHYLQKSGLTGRSAVFLVLLLVGSATGNYFYYPVLLSSQIMFGSAVVLITLRLFGMTWGLFAAVLAGICASIITKIPYIAFLLIAEILFLGLLPILSKSRATDSMTRQDGLFWLGIGMPVIFILYFNMMGADASTAWLATLKFGVNGILNTLIASLVVSYFPFGRLAPEAYQPKLLRHYFYDLIVAAILLPSLILSFAYGRHAMTELEHGMKDAMNIEAEGVRSGLDFWLQRHFYVLDKLAVAGVELINSDPAGWRNIAAFARTALPDVTSMEICLPDASPFSSTQQKCLKSLQLVSSSQAKEKHLSLLRGSVMDGWNLDVIVPVWNSERFLGALLATVDLRNAVTPVIATPTHERPVYFTLLDEQRRVIVSSVSSGIEPQAENLSPAYYTHGVRLGSIAWTLLAESSAAPLYGSIQNIYIRAFIVIWAFFALSCIIASLASRRLVQPLNELVRITTNLPEKLENESPFLIEKKHHSVEEIDMLLSNFRRMAFRLSASFHEIRSVNELLERRVDDRTRELADTNQELQQKVLALLQAEVNLSRRESSFRALIENSFDIILVLKPDGKITYGSPSVERLLGYSPESLPEILIETLFHPDDMPRIVEILQHGFSSKAESWADEFRIRHTNGAWRAFDMRGRFVVDRFDTPVIVVNAWDITERQCDENILTLQNGIDHRALRGQSPEQLLSFLCESLVGICDYQLVWAGKKKEDGSVDVLAFAGPASDYLMDMSATGVRWDQTPHGNGPTGRAIRTGKPCTLKVDAPEFGPWQAIAKNFGIQSVVAFPLTIREDTIGAFVFYSRDRDAFDAPENILKLAKMTSRISVTLGIAMDEQKLRLQGTALATTASAVFITDRNGHVEWVNAAFSRLSGYHQDEILGRTLRIIKSDQHDAAFYRSLWEKILRGEVWHGEITNRRRDGSLYISAQSITPIVDEMGEIRHFVSIQEDITDRKRSEESLRELSSHLQHAREEERFGIAREIHDELGGALTTLNMDLRWVQKRMDDAALRERIDAMIELVGISLQSVRRISSDLRPGVLENLGLIPAIEWLAREFQQRMDIRCHLATDMVEVTLDKARSIAVFRIVQETLTNIARHAQATEVDIIIACGNGQLRIDVGDNGVGIDEKAILSLRSYGILGMYERTRQLGGELNIGATKKYGCLVSLCIPLGHKQTEESL